jgi:Kef-type K+ transport system membrane component KefB
MVLVENIFIELAVVITIATIISLIFYKLRQPVILAYIITGILLGASFLNVIAYNELLTIFSELGIAFLLFLVGINLDPKILREVGKTSLVTGLGQVIFTSFAGYLISIFLGYGFIESIYIAVALTFSSTIIIVKLLSDKGEINSLYGKIALGFLLVQDAVAIIALILITSLSVQVDTGAQLMNFGLSIVGFIIFVFIASKFVTKRVFKILSKNQEILFIGSIAWCFVFIAISLFIGISKEIGAFLAGILIAQLPYSQEISNKLRGLRDFFIVLFFVVLGSSLVFSSSETIILYSIIFSIFILVGNPIIVLILMFFLGYKGRTSFLSSLTVAQISEFSLILIFLGERVGHLSPEVAPMITLTGIITISVSTYLILHNNRIYDYFASVLPILKSKRFLEDSLHIAKEKKYDIVCVGFGKTGSEIFKNHKDKDNLLIIEFDPTIIKSASKKGYNTIYGDVSDLETIKLIEKTNAKIVISTIADVPTNELIAKRIKKMNSNSTFICIAEDSFTAKDLYKSGASYVIIPSITMSEKIDNILHDIKKGNNFELYWLEKKLKNEL